MSRIDAPILLVIEDDSDQVSNTDVTISMDMSTAWPKSDIHTWNHGCIRGYQYPRQACPYIRASVPLECTEECGLAVSFF